MDLELNISKYESINTKERVDIIVDDLIGLKTITSSDINEVLKKIDRLSLQIYFIVMLEYSTSEKISVSNTINAVDWISLSCYSLIDLSILQISNYLSLPVGVVKCVFKKNIMTSNSLINFLLTDNFIPSKDELSLCMYFIENSVKINIRKTKKEIMIDLEEKLYPLKWNKRKLPKLYGKKGNYFKLIYIRTKT